MSEEDRRADYVTKCLGEYQTMGYENTKNKTFAELEQMALEAGLRLAVKLLETRLEGDPRGDPEGSYPCPGCGKPFRIQERAQVREIQTVVGKVGYNRPYAVCDRCQKTSVPLDEVLGIPPTGSSVGYLQKTCHASVVGRSFEDASQVLLVQAEISVSPKHVRTLAENEGSRIIQQRGEAVKAFQNGVPTKFSGKPPELIVVTADGGRVQTRHKTKTERWKEDKIGAVYDAVPAPQPNAPRGEYEGAHALTKTYVATMDDWEKMGWSLRLEAECRGYLAAREKLFVSDGARVIRELRAYHFPEATFILDWPHAVEHLTACANAAHGEGSAAARRWFEKHTDLLWDGKVDRIINDLQTLSEQAGPPSEGDSDRSPRRVLHRNAFSYFPNNRDGMKYPEFRAKGWPIGSGVAEGAVKQFALRVKGSEKFWNIDGANEILALCALYHSEDGRWLDYWRHRGRPHSASTPP